MAKRSNFRHYHAGIEEPLACASKEGMFTSNRESKLKSRPGPASKLLSTIFIGKWTVLILSALQEKPHRHGQLRRRLGNVSQRMLTRTLRNLESTGLIARRATNSRKSLAVEYSLTSLGRSFIRPLNSICAWAHQHHKELNAVVRLRSTGEPPAT